jgi:hypothetical protein
MNFLFVKRSLPLAVRSYSVFHSTRVSSNIFSDAIGQFASKRAESSKGTLFSYYGSFAFLVVVDKQFAEMIQLMTTHKEWTLRPWKKVMEEQLSSWLMYIPGMSTSKEAKDMKGMKGNGKADYFILH